jgi:protein TonB
VSSTDRAGTLAAVAFSLAVHVAGGIWFATRPPMFRTTRPQAPIEVALVPARPLPPVAEPDGGGAPEEARPAPPRPDEMSRPARPAPPGRPRPVRTPPPEAALPQARVVDAGPAAATLPAGEVVEPAPGALAAADLGIGAGGMNGGAGGRGGSGRGTGSGDGDGGDGAGAGAIVKPRELRRPSLAEMRALYPEQARRDGLQAKVRLQLLVDAAGRVADVRVVRAAGHGFDEAATALARRFVFEPGRRDGRPAAMWITLTYSFEIEG